MNDITLPLSSKSPNLTEVAYVQWAVSLVIADRYMYFNVTTICVQIC